MSPTHGAPRPRVRLKVQSLAFGGDGVGRDPQGRVVLVPNTTPGDEVEVVIVQEKKGHARGEIARLICPSPSRVTPPCPLFVAGCGGCQWQQVGISAQRAAKEDVVRRALRHVTDDVEPMRAPSPEYNWRRRARLHFRRVGDGPAIVGYAMRRSHRLIDVGTCPQLEKPLDRALVAIRHGLASSLEGAGEIDLLLGGRGDVQAVVRGHGVREMAEHARSLLGREGIVSVALWDKDGQETIGTPVIDLADDPLPFLARADVFAQVSAAGNAELRRLVAMACGDLSGHDVLELFAGSGNFTRDLGLAKAVTSIEEAPMARELGLRNLSLRGLEERVDFIGDRVERALLSMTRASHRFDVVVLDPPRTGLPPGLADLLAALSPARIVYVSCDPPTLARDLIALAAAGPFRTEKATPVDLMPQTYHVEAVATVVRHS
ncbi:MAG: class I SAM-dependent RNA methyltransferase [Deltaproteobacteria bacterium]|nr:class I SAM-dependent RNA methyltransferase [Deltaproteobacteria bacterium]